MGILNIELSKDTKPIYKELYLKIKDQIINGDLKKSFKLPTIRELSDQLCVNSVTVVNAYKLLESENLISKKVGSGSFVSYPNTIEIGMDYLDFTGKDSNIEQFPLAEFKDSINETLNIDGVDSFKYENSQGFPLLKEALVKYFKNFNINCSEREIQIVSGGQQALDIISKTLLEFGDTVITEKPTYMGACENFTAREARVLSIEMQQDGIDLDRLESKLQVRVPNFLYLIPYNQKPTGINYSLDKLKRVIELAEKYNFYIVEDDIGSELLLEDNISLKSMDIYDRVIYIKSFSPLFMPGLRLGAIISPEKLYSRLVKVKAITDISTPGLIQRAFTRYLNSDSYKNYYRSMAENLRKKWKLTKSLLENIPHDHIDFSSKYPTNYFWIKLKEISSSEFCKKCSVKGIEVVNGTTMGYEFENYIMLNIKSIPLSNIEKGISIIKNILVTS